MPDTTPPLYRVTFVLNSRRESYDAPAISITEMAHAAIGYRNPGADASSFTAFSAAWDEANRFANFCVAEMVDETGKWCDPTRSFRDLWSKFIESEQVTP